MLDKKKRYGFLPGCSLSSYHPEAVAKTVEYLNLSFPEFSAILKCCGKPTKDIGQYELYQRRFRGLLEDMEDTGVEEMIFACPNCKASSESDMEIPAHSLYAILQQNGFPEEVKGKAKDSDMVFTIHDSCSARFDQAAQDGVRFILKELGYHYVESEYAREKTKCCGYGGQVQTVNPELFKKVMKRRIETLEPYPVVVYCSTCRSAFLQNGVKAWHILDLIWGPVVYAKDKPNPDVLATPDKVWHNRFETREQIKKVMEIL